MTWEFQSQWCPSENEPQGPQGGVASIQVIWDRDWLELRVVTEMEDGLLQKWKESVIAQNVALLSGLQKTEWASEEQHSHE